MSAKDLFCSVKGQNPKESQFMLDNAEKHFEKLEPVTVEVLEPLIIYQNYHHVLTYPLTNLFSTKTHNCINRWAEFKPNDGDVAHMLFAAVGPGLGVKWTPPLGHKMTHGTKNRSLIIIQMRQSINNARSGKKKS